MILINSSFATTNPKTSCFKIERSGTEKGTSYGPLPSEATKEELQLKYSHFLLSFFQNAVRYTKRPPDYGIDAMISKRATFSNSKLKIFHSINQPHYKNPCIRVLQKKTVLQFTEALNISYTVHLESSQLTR